MTAAFLGAASCTVAGDGGAPPPAAAWRLVDEEGPQGRRLWLEPEEAAGPILEVRILREAAPVGEIVEAEVRAVGLRGRRVVEVRPSRPEVRLLGPRRWILEGEAPVRVRFTCGAPGPGGIAVRVLEE
ncbi:MAG: hypothetical protein ACK44W_06230 [Planctomycetota bacterium]